MENIKIAICDNLTTVQNVLNNNSKEEVLFLTKNVCLYNKLKSIDGINVEFLELERSPAEYSFRAWDFIDELNEVIHNVTGDKSYLYQLNYHVEGNSLAQNVITMLAYYDYFDKWVKQYQLIDITIYYTNIYQKETELLYYFCQKQKIKLKVIWGRERWNLAYASMRVRLIFGSPISKKITILSSALNNVQLIFERRGGYRKTREIASYDIGMVKQSANYKDYLWTKDYLDLLNREGITNLIICMDEMVQQKWLEFGYKAVNLQESITRRDILKLFISHCCKARKVCRAISKHLEKQGHTADREKVLIDIYQYIYYQTFRGSIQDLGASRFFELYKFGIIEYHGSTNYLSSKICYYNVRKNEQSTKFKNCTGSLQIVEEYNYEPNSSMSDFGFVISKELDRLNYKIGNVAGRQYIIKNTTYSKDFYLNQFKKEQLKNELSILWAPSYPSIEFTSYKCFNETGINLLDFFSQNPNGCLNVKFHPNQIKSEVVDFINRSDKIRNISLIEKNESIREALGKVDILITNCSLSILDGVVEKKAVIIVVSEYEYDLLKHLAEGIHIVADFAELNMLLGKLMKDSNMRKEWIEQSVNRQEAFFKQYIGEETESKKILSALRNELEGVTL